MALSCVAPRSVPYTMAAGLAHLITGVAFVTLSCAVAVVPRYFAVSVGVNDTESVWPLPAPRSVPAGGSYTNVPGTPAVALSWVAPSAVPYTMSAGLAHVITGVA